MAKIRKHNQTEDAGFKKTDEQLKDLEDRLSSLYTDASKEMETKLGKFLDQYSERDKQKRELVQQGKMTETDYAKWRQGQIFQTKKMQAQVDNLTETMVNTDKLAMQMVNGELPSVYANNYNFQGYKAEQMAQAGGIDYSSFTIYNADAVSRLAKDNPDLLPKPKVDIPKDTKWNKTKINTAISQGILQGEPINDIAARLRQVTDMDYNAAVRNARTATIGAQNAGRKDASERIKETSGLEMVDVWSATYDERTRESHIMLDGQERQADGYFHTITGDRLEYPCDPNGSPEEVYNCRCRLNTVIKGIDHSHDDELYAQFMEENYYDDWLVVKEQTESKKELFDNNKAALEEKLPKTKDLLPAEVLTSGKMGIVQGNNITSTWERREDQFEFEIDDVIDAQGFNGLPRVVSEEEFNKAVQSSNFIAQRTYSAPDQETLNEYQNQLYNGDWYVNCSTGGAAYGQGMYVAGNTKGVMTQSIREEMDYYQTNNFGSLTKVETMTVTPDFKTIDFKEIKPEFFFSKIEEQYGNDAELMKAVQEGRQQRAEGVRGNPFYKNIKSLVKENYGESEYESLQSFFEQYIGFDSEVDEGVMATLLGYDGILTHEVTPNIASKVNADDSQHIVILNRSKVIFKGE